MHNGALQNAGPLAPGGWLNRDASNVWEQNWQFIVRCASQQTQQLSLERLLERELDRCELVVELLELVLEMVLATGECAPLLAVGRATLLGISVTRRQ